MLISKYRTNNNLLPQSSKMVGRIDFGPALGEERLA